MIDPNVKLRLVGGYTARPVFDESTFSETHYKMAYDLYWLLKIGGHVFEKLDLVGNDVIKFLTDNDMRAEFPKLNALREQCATKRLAITIYNTPRHYETQSSHLDFWAWGMLTMHKTNGEEVEGLMVLWNGKKLDNEFGVIKVPNGFKVAYDD